MSEDAAKKKLREMIEAKKRGEKVAAPAGNPTTDSNVASSKPSVSRPDNAPKKHVSAPVKLAPATASSHPTTGTAILVDANKRAAATLAGILQTRKVKSEIAETGAAALKLLETVKPLMVLVDTDLPDISGFNLCSKVRATANGRDTCIVITSETYDPTMKDKALMVEANGYLNKPVNYADLIAILQEFREQQQKQKTEPRS